MFFLTPKYIKQGRLYVKAAEKKLAYNRDVWTPETCAAMEGLIAALKLALKEKSRERVAESEKAIEGFCGTHCPVGQYGWISENDEVVLVAIIVALGIRTFVVQPFTIPTSSMSPTLKGITGKRTTEPPPNPLLQALQFATHGRSWHEVIALADERVTSVKSEVREGPRRFFEYTKITTDKGNVYWVNAASQPVEDTFGGPTYGGRGSLVGMTFKQGEPIVRGYTDTGDHVFVNKFIYHFRKPTRGEVIVFLTQNIEGLGNPGPPPRLLASQFYIKRLVGVPGDELSIASPQLFVNGAPGTEAGLRRVMEGSKYMPVGGGYMGYGPGPMESQAYNMASPTQKFTVPERTYFPMGDNSYFSKDGRYFGPVPQDNMCGSGFLVYWPFLRDGGSHFGLIR